MMRGRIVSANGIKAEDLKAPPSASWVLQSDRGITYAGELPQGSRAVEPSAAKPKQRTTSMPGPIDCDLPLAPPTADRRRDCSDQLERISACTELAQRAHQECGWRRGPRRLPCLDHFDDKRRRKGAAAGERPT